MITIFDWFGYELPTKKRYSLIKEAGFDGVLMWWSLIKGIMKMYLYLMSLVKD